MGWVREGHGGMSPTPPGGSASFSSRVLACVAAIESAGLRLSELRPDLDPDMTTKSAAVACYPSQLLALRLSPTFDADIETERYWSLSPG